LTVPFAENKSVDAGTEQVGGFAWPGRDAIEQLRFTVPVTPRVVTEKFPLALVPVVNMMALLVNEKAGAGTRIAGAFAELEGALVASPG
jgi:hypothetical protein